MRSAPAAEGDGGRAPRAAGSGDAASNAPVVVGGGTTGAAEEGEVTRGTRVRELHRKDGDNGFAPPTPTHTRAVTSAARDCERATRMRDGTGGAPTGRRQRAKPRARSVACNMRPHHTDTIYQQKELRMTLQQYCAKHTCVNSSGQRQGGHR